MKYFIATFLTVTILAACESSDGGKEKLLSDITYLEQEIGAEARPDAEKLDTLMVKLENYASAFPQDTLSANLLYRAGEIARMNGQFEKALEIYEGIIGKHTEAPEAARALFMKGFTLDNDLKRLDEAKAVYEDFLQKYPNDDFADDANFLLKNLGKTEEEIIREFEAGQRGN